MDTNKVEFTAPVKKYNTLPGGVPLTPSLGFIPCDRTDKGQICLPMVYQYELIPDFPVETVEHYAQTGGTIIHIGTQPELEFGLSKKSMPVLSSSPFSTDAQGNLLYDTGKNVYKIANFTVDLKCKKRIVGLTETKEKIDVRVHNACQDITWSLLKSEWQSFATKLKAEHPEFYLYVDYPNAAKVFQQYIASLYESHLQTLPETLFYETAGWYEMPDGRAHYVSGLDDNCDSARCLAEICSTEEARELWQYGQRILQIGDLETLLPLFLQLHIGYTLAFFEKAGHPVQFLMALIGPTGSRKTALARCLYCLFDNTEVVNFTATDRGIELIAMKCHDAVMVLDDLSAAKDKQLINKLNRILRQVGDSAGRVKSTNGGRDIERVDTRFAVVITAEAPLDNLQQSGQLRILTVKISPSTIQNARLRELQDERNLAKMEKRPSRLEQYISVFVRFLEAQYKECLQHIMTFQAPELPMAFARQAEIYRALSCMATLILRAGVYYQAITHEKAKQIYQEQWLPVLQKLMKKNELQGQVSDPVYMFISALSQLVATKQLAIADTKELFQQRAGQYGGFYAQDILCLKPDVAYTAAQAYWKSLDLPMETVAAELFSRLSKLRISQGYEQKGHAPKKLKSITINKEKMKILCIDWEKAKQYLKDNEQGGLFYE